MPRLRLMLDSNISHALHRDDGLRESLTRAVDSGSVELLVTHIQVDENLDHPDPEEGRRLIHAMMGSGARAVPTYGVVLDVSRLGSARLFDEGTAAMFEAFRHGNPKHSQDGLIAATALREGAVLVTAENVKHRRRLQAHFSGLVVWSLEDLREHMNAQSEDVQADLRGMVAAGSVITQAFVGPGETESAITLNTGDMSGPHMTISFVPPPDVASDDETDPSTAYVYRVHPERAGWTRFAVTVRRHSPGQEPQHVFRWTLAQRPVARDQ